MVMDERGGALDVDEVVLSDPETPVAPVKLDSLKILKKIQKIQS